MYNSWNKTSLISRWRELDHLSRRSVWDFPQILQVARSAWNAIGIEYVNSGCMQDQFITICQNFSLTTTDTIRFQRTLSDGSLDVTKTTWINPSGQTGQKGLILALEGTPGKEF